jgi:16S rRNA (cytidine1402-2'-O)-methyltransferase
MAKKPARRERALADERPRLRAASDASPNEASERGPRSKRPGEAGPPSPAGLASAIPSGLVLVATPIGNAGDIGLRAIKALERADILACEDTRVTGRLLKRLDVTASMTAYHEHNAERVRPILLEFLRDGKTVALVSDAGTPLISDPGYKLVRACITEGLPVTAVPGPSAVLAALTLSGLPTDRFLFAGFLPPRRGTRRRELAEIKDLRATLVFFESARRLASSLADMADLLGPRAAAVAREMTKLFEEVRRADLPDLARHYAERGAPKGEVVVVVAPPGPGQPATMDDVKAHLGRALESMSVRDAAAAVAAATGVPRRRVYECALALAAKGGIAKNPNE